MTMITAACVTQRLQARLDGYALQGKWRRSTSTQPPDGASVHANVGVRQVVVPTTSTSTSPSAKESEQGDSRGALPLTLVAPGCTNGSQAWQCLYSTGSQSGFLAWTVPNNRTTDSWQRFNKEALLDNHPLWIHVIGDSTMRFFYAAWLSLFNGTQSRQRGYPLHWLPDDDACSFIRVKWVTDSTNECYRRWRGTCNSICSLDAVSSKSTPWAWRLSFEWLSHRHVGSKTYLLASGTRFASAAPSLALMDWLKEGGAEVNTKTNLAATDERAWYNSQRYTINGSHAQAITWRSPTRRSSSASSAERQSAPQVVLFGAGVHEAVGGVNSYGAASESRYLSSLNRTLGLVRRLRGFLPPECWLVITGNGACKRQQVNHWKQSRRKFPNDAFERLVTGPGNAFLRAEAAFMPRTLFLDRAPSMETIERVGDSPCWQHHPYGMLAETHVQMIANTLFHGTTKSCLRGAR